MTGDRKGPGALPRGDQRGRDEERVPPRRPKQGEEKREPLKVPHDAVNEQVVLAAAMVDLATRRKLLDLVQPESFFAKGHAEAWRAFGALERRGLAYDPATVKQLAGDGVDTAYLDQLVELRPAVPPNLMHHVACLAWDRTRIEAVRGPVASLLELLRDPSADPSDVRAKARMVGDVFGFSGSLLLDTQAVALAQAKRMTERRLGQAHFPFGIDGLDLFEDGEPRLIPGAAPGKLTVLTGLSGSGKSTVLGRMVLGLAEQGRRVLWGSWEEDEGDSLEQVAVMSLGYSRRAFQTGRFTEEQQAVVEEEMERLRPWVRFFALPKYERRVAGKRRSPISDRALDLIHENIVASACHVFVADLWRRMVREFDPNEEELALTAQQQILKDSGVHGVLVHQQLLKDIEKWSASKRPTREGLKGSGTWVEVPDLILGVHRPALWKNVEDNTLEVLVLKQRRAKWPLCVEFTFEPDSATLTEGRSVDVKRENVGEGTDDLDSFLSSTHQHRGRGQQRKK